MSHKHKHMTTQPNTNKFQTAYLAGRITYIEYAALIVEEYATAQKLLNPLDADFVVQQKILETNMKSELGLFDT